MDEETGPRTAVNENKVTKRYAQMQQGPLLTFFLTAMELEAALVTQQEILREFARLKSTSPPALRKEKTGTRQMIVRLLEGVLRGSLIRWNKRMPHGREGIREQSDWEAKERQLCKRVYDLREKTQRALDALYAGRGFRNAYRTLPALACIYEYFQEGRCNTLDGRLGAYCIFDAEVRAGTAARQADEVWTRSAEVFAQHPLLEQEMTQVRETAARVAREAAQADAGKGMTRLETWNAFEQDVGRMRENSEK